MTLISNNVEIFNSKINKFRSINIEELMTKTLENSVEAAKILSDSPKSLNTILQRNIGYVCGIRDIYMGELKDEDWYNFMEEMEKLIPQL